MSDVFLEEGKQASKEDKIAISDVFVTGIIEGTLLHRSSSSGVCVCVCVCLTQALLVIGKTIRI